MNRQPPIAKASQRKAIAKAPLVTPTSLQAAVEGSAAGLNWAAFVGQAPRTDERSAMTPTPANGRSHALEMSIQQVLQSRPQAVRDQEDKQWRVESNKEKARELKRQLKAGAMDTSVEQDRSSNKERNGDGDELMVTSHTAQSQVEAPTPMFSGFGLAPVDQVYRFPAPKPFLFPTPAPPPPPQAPFNAPIQMQVDDQSAHTLSPDAQGQQQEADMEADDEVDSEDDDDDDDMGQLTVTVTRSPSASASGHHLPQPLILPSLSNTPAPAPLPSSSASPSTSKLKVTPKARYRPAAPLTRGRSRKPRAAVPSTRRMELFDYLSSGSENEGGLTALGDDWTAPAPEPGSYAEREARRQRLPRGGRALGGKDTTHLAPISTHSKRTDLPAEDRELLPASRAHAEKLVPTSYQTALLEKAKEGNVITCMPTGSGKTLVAVSSAFVSCKDLELTFGSRARSYSSSTSIQSSNPRASPLSPKLPASPPKPTSSSSRRGRGSYSSSSQTRSLSSISKPTSWLTSEALCSFPPLFRRLILVFCSTSLRVGKLFGALGVNLSNKEEWKHNFETYE